MVKAQLYKVELYIEVPDTVGPPTDWNWGNLVNPDGTAEDAVTPVTFRMAYQVKEGNA